MSRSLLTQARHKHWFQFPVLSQSTRQKAARVNLTPTNHGLIYSYSNHHPFFAIQLTPYSRTTSRQHHAMSEKKGNHIIGTEACYNPLNPSNQVQL